MLGLALDVYLDVGLREAREPLVALTGPETSGIPIDESNIVLDAFRRTFEHRGRAAPRIAIELRNEIPLGRGLGSSGAAAVAGVALANESGNLGLSRLEQIAIAAEIEGHPDNVAASCLGGFTISCATEAGLEAVSLPWPANIAVIVAIPDAQLETKQARAALPASYSRADAVFNLQRVALLVAAVAAGTARPELLAAALRDRLHQPYRAPLVPGLREALELRAPGLLAIALSGAGPSLIGFVDGDPQPAISALQQLYSQLGVRGHVRRIKVDNQGVTVLHKESEARLAT